MRHEPCSIQKPLGSVKGWLWSHEGVKCSKVARTIACLYAAIGKLMHRVADNIATRDIVPKHRLPAFSMFTGIIQQLGKVIALDSNDFGAALLIDPRHWTHTASIGESIAVNGCCLTVARHGGMDDSSQNANDSKLRFDVIQQTLATTTIGQFRPGDAVNLERAVTPTTMLGGHIVQGHVDGVGKVVQLRQDQSQWRLRIEPPVELMDCIVEKGSIAVEGVSLTVAAAGHDWFDIALIPTTLELTNLGRLRQGSRVNLETDYIAKAVVSWLKRQGHFDH